MHTLAQQGILILLIQNSVHTVRLESSKARFFSSRCVRCVEN